MIDIIYTLVYIIPLILLTGSTLFVELADVGEKTKTGAPMVFMLFVAVLLTVIINVGNKIRVIVSGSLLALLLGAYLVTDGEMRRQWFAANSWLWIALALAVGVVVIGTVMLRVRYVKLAVGIILAGLLVSSYWTWIIEDKISVVSTVFLIITILSEEIRYRRRGGGLIRDFMVRVVPFLLIGMTALYYMPASEKPYDWAAARRIINNIEDGITNFLQRFEDDSLDDIEATLGFSENAVVSGNVAGDIKEMMTVTFGQGAPDCVYLDGKYFEDFDGRKWSEAGKTYPYMLDTLEARCAIMAVDPSVSHDYYRIVELDITYTGQYSGYMFAPVKSLVCNVRVNDTVLDYAGNEILFDRKMGNTTNYRVDYIIPNQNSSILPILTEFGEMTDSERWESERAKFGLKEDIYSYEEFLKYRQSIYDNSLCPHAIAKDELSEGVRNFLDNALAGAETDYEKLKALAAALSSLEYTSSPGALPRRVDTPEEFLDYFILESKKGYCNSFATAFVLLCRAEGIPARYVHGYCVTRDGSRTVTVLNSMAHAYPEAYLKGLGWVVFEPTPGFAAGAAWDERGRFEQHVNSFVPNTHVPELLEGAGDNNEPEETSVLEWYMIVIPLALCLLVLVVIALVERAINIRRFNRLDSEKRAHVISLRIMNLLKHQGFVKADYETVREYAARAHDEEGISLEGFADAFEKILYSSEHLTEEEIRILDEEYELIKGSLKGKDKVMYSFLNFMGLG